jgi:NADH-quinone oxidoreductase subunit N
MPAYYLEALTVILGILLLMAEAFSSKRSKAWVGGIAAGGLALILVALFFAAGPAQQPDAGWAKGALWNLYQFDGLAKFYKGFALVTTMLVVLLSIDYRSILARYTDHAGSEAGTGEFYALPVFACAGMMWMASAKDLATAFVSLELVTITFYVLVAYLRRNVGSLEAGVKYLILGALSTGFLVYGIAWVYGSTGTMHLAEIGDRIAFQGFAGSGPIITSGTTGALIQEPVNYSALLFGIGLVMVALGFKVGAVPMQVWIPDVYQGAPTPTTAFLSVGSKAAGFVLLLRFIEPFLGETSPVRNQVLVLLAILACVTLIFGNLAAIPQTNFKRLLAYSSIAHAGFLLLALAAWSEDGANLMGSVKTVSFYLATYLLMTLGAFFVMAQVRIQNDGERIEDFNGLGQRNPLLALSLTVLLAALAGVPLTAGFWGKLFVFSLAVKQGLWWGVGLGFVAAAAGFYYYFKTIRAMWWQPSAEGAKAIALPTITRSVLVVITVLVLVLGIWSEPVRWLLGAM